MDCPKELSDDILDIIRMASLRIRAAGREDDPNRCAVEANHIHNLPNLLRDYRDEKLLYYCEMEIRGFVTSSEGVSIECFRPHWSRLARYIELNRLASDFQERDSPETRLDTDV